MSARIGVLAMLLSQAVWVYAQNGWVECVHADGEARTEPAGDSCCADAKADHGRQPGTWMFEPDECACLDYALSFSAPQFHRNVRIDLPSLEIDLCLPDSWGEAAFGREPQPGFADHGPPRAGPLEHLETVVLRL